MAASALLARKTFEFMIYLWGVPNVDDAEQKARALQEAGFTVVDWDPGELDVLEKYGLAAMVHDATPELAARIREHPALWGYHLADEPYPEDTFAAIAQRMRAIERADPEHIPFVNMLVPIVTFVHWNVVEPPARPAPEVKRLSRRRYQELLWHLLLRGHDALFVWSPPGEAIQETLVVHEVYRSSHRYRDFLLEAEPAIFDVPRLPSPVVSAMRKGSRLLVLRSDFDDTREPLSVTIDGHAVEVPPSDGEPLWLELR